MEFIDKNDIRRLVANRIKQSRVTQSELGKRPKKNVSWVG